jgi:hypothetical protein
MAPSTPTQAVFAYSVFVNTPAEPGPVSAKFGSILLPCGPIGGVPPDLVQFGVSKVVNDVVSGGPGLFTRTLTLSLEPPIGIPTPVNPQPQPFRGFIVSSDPNDNFDGQTTYLDTTNLTAKLDGVPLRGTDLTPLITPNKFGIQTLTFFNGKVPAGLVVLSNDANQPVFVIPNDWTGSIVSSSPADAAGGIGLQQLRIHYLDSLSNPQQEDVFLNGQTGVPLVNNNKRTITSLEPLAYGSFGMNAGTISIKSAKNGGGSPMAGISQSFNQSFPIGTDQACLFRGIYTHVLAASMGSAVTVGPVTIS